MSTNTHATATDPAALYALAKQRADAAVAALDTAADKCRAAYRALDAAEIEAAKPFTGPDEWLNRQAAAQRAQDEVTRLNELRGLIQRAVSEGRYQSAAKLAESL